jgi:hypothetical protein
MIFSLADRPAGQCQRSRLGWSMGVQMVFLQLQIRQQATATILRATLLSAAAVVARNSTYTGNCTMTEFTTPSILMIGQSTILTAPPSHQQLSFW